ncbi:hypothetical protein HBE96_23175 [Clostridium sp. P21]|uniref:Uncharacterized protein n=1 Tax=Clostridium muellerianum TaxID=2716538 RepID=A0A7Y0EL48_9CLOT|nr:hypothetical protein [Clostridium muellerianum]NMM65484.1 hypothetical protein [Clostridium muellerianum]
MSFDEKVQEIVKLISSKTKMDYEEGLNFNNNKHCKLIILDENKIIIKSFEFFGEDVSKAFKFYHDYLSRSI